MNVTIDHYLFYFALAGYLLGTLHYLLFVVSQNRRVAVVATAIGASPPTTARAMAVAAAERDRRRAITAPDGSGATRDSLIS